MNPASGPDGAVEIEGRQVIEGDRPAAVLAIAWPHLSAVAHRLAGDAPGGAERAVHDAWRRWTDAERSAPTGFPARLTSAAHLFAVEVIKAARRPPGRTVPSRHGRPIEPGTGPGTESERAQAAELVVVVLREQLSPPEVAAFVLRKTFACPPSRLRDILLSGAAALDDPGLRAVPAIRGPRSRPPAPRRIVRAFRAAARSANLADVEDLLGADLVDRPVLWRRAPQDHARLSQRAPLPGPTG